MPTGRSPHVAGSSINVGGTYTPLVGDFDGNGVTDLFWYAPGSAGDYLWLFTSGGGFTQITKSVNGTYQPFVGDFVVGRRAGATTSSGTPPAPAPTHSGDGLAVATSTSIPQSVSGTYQPLVGIVHPEHAPTAAPTRRSTSSGTGPGRARLAVAGRRRRRTSRRIALQRERHLHAVVGYFDGYGVQDIFWYSP